MKCYHMTSIDRLKSIGKHGLTPHNEENSKLVNDNKIKVFFSEGFEGTIALFVDFDKVYNEIKNGETILDNVELNNKILSSKSLEEYLRPGVYLSFDKQDIYNERNFENGCTDNIIIPEMLNVLLLKDSTNNIYIYSRFEIIKYMMSKTKVQNIKYYGVKYPGSPNFDVATERIQNKINKFYNENKEKIEKYNNDDYKLIEIPLNMFIKEYIC